MKSKFQYRVLALDGGGSKGVYTLGVLREIEAILQCPLGSHFDLIYGTSTGAIIASMLSLGWTVSSAEEKYFQIIPLVMGHSKPRKRSEEFTLQAKKLFQDKRFNSFTTNVGIVATNCKSERPLIFKSAPEQAHGRTATFAAGFDCTIVDALRASTAAYPFFERVSIKTSQGELEAMDGGFVANNPTLFAIADALKAEGATRSNIKIVSVGVGRYNEPKHSLSHRILFNIPIVRLVQNQLATNTNTVETLRRLFFSDISCIRIDEAFPDPRYATDLLDSDVKKLRELVELGRDSFAHFETEFRAQLL